MPFKLHASKIKVTTSLYRVFKYNPHGFVLSVSESFYHLSFIPNKFFLKLDTKKYWGKKTIGGKAVAGRKEKVSFDNVLNWKTRGLEIAV